MSRLAQLKKRIEKIEERVAPKHKGSTEILLWLGQNHGGGLYGHGRINIYTGETTPCSDEEEMKIMRETWEARGHKCWGRKGEESVSFEEFLKRVEYLKRKPDKKSERDGT